MQDAETGEQLVVDTSDPGFRRRFQEAAEARDEQLAPRSDAPGADLYDVSTDDDIVRVIAAHGRHAQAAGPPVTFQEPSALWLLLLVPVLVAGYLWIAKRRTADEQELGTMARPASRTGRPLGWRRHVVPLLFLVGVVVLLVGMARPQATHRPSTSGGHRGPRVRRLGEHEGQGPRADPDRSRQARRAHLHRRPAVDHPHRRRRVQRRRLRGATPDPSTTEVLAAIDRLVAARRHRTRAWDPHVAERGRGQADRPRPDALENGAASPASASSVRRPSCSCPTATTPPQLDPLALASVAAQAGVRIFPIGIGSASGAVVDIDGYQVATALDADLLRRVAERSGGTYFAPRDAASLERVYDSHRPPALDQRTQHRDHRDLRRRRAAAVPARRRALDALVRAGDLMLRFLWPFALLGLLAPAARDRGVPLAAAAGGASTR